MITREQFLSGFDSWVQNKSRRLPEILEAQKAINPDERNLLERLAATFIAKHGGDVEKSLAAVSSVPEVKSGLKKLGDADLEASLGHVGQAVVDSFASTLPTPPDSFGRFRILRPHARGGLGQVSVALDQELHREVALKEILPDHTDRVSRERFLLEAEITGGLEHPGIVPVYALGLTPDGRPYYAMRFVKGDSLKHAIEQFHRPDNPDRNDSGKRQLALRQLLGRFIDVCNAVEYAHSRGILHRDLKPGNIMVGKYGETLVVDWGLAKAIGKKDIPCEEQTLRPMSVLSSSGQTQPGSALGTPAYMSPEQAAGKLDELRPTTDVYSLGATLYHLLTGRSPFEKQEFQELIRKIETGEFPKPKSLDSTIPRSLEAICLKAMAVKPHQRYSTARTLADDIEHWLADEPVSVIRDGISSKLARAGRRYRGIVATVLMASILFAIASTVAAIIFNQQRRTNAEIANREAELNKANQLLAVEEKRQREAAQQQQKNAENLAAANQLLALQEKRQRETAQEEEKRAVSLANKLQIREANLAFARAVEDEGDERFFKANIDFYRALALLPEDDGMRASISRIATDRFMRAVVFPTFAHNANSSKIALAGDGSILWNNMKTINIKTGVVVPPPGFVTSRTMPNTPGTRALGLRRQGTNESESVRILWDLSTGEIVGSPASNEIPNNWQFSDDGTMFVTVSKKGVVRAWDSDTGSPIGPPLEDSQQVGESVRVKAPTYTSDRGVFVLLDQRESAAIWHLDRTTIKWTRLLTGNRVEISTERSYAVLFEDSSPNRTFRIYDLNSMKFVGDLLSQGSNTDGYAVFSPRGGKFITPVQDKNSQIWDAATATAIGKPIDCDALHLEFSPDGTRICNTSQSSSASRLWDANTGEVVTVISQPLDESKPRSMKRIFSESIDNEDDGVSFSSTESFSFSPDGRYVLAGTTEPVGENAYHDKLKLFDAKTGALLREFSRSNSAAFSPDGQHIAILGFTTEPTNLGIAAAASTDSRPSMLPGRPAISIRVVNLESFKTVAESFPQVDIFQTKIDISQTNVRFTSDGMHVVLYGGQGTAIQPQYWTPWCDAYQISVLECSNAQAGDSRFYASPRWREFFCLSGKTGVGRIINVAQPILTEKAFSFDHSIVRKTWRSDSEGQPIVPLDQEYVFEISSREDKPNPFDGPHVAFSPKGDRVVIQFPVSGPEAQDGRQDHKTVVWIVETESGRLLGEPILFPDTHVRFPGAPVPVIFDPTGHRFIFHCTNFSRDRKRAYGKAQLLDAQTGLPIANAEGTARDVYRVEFSPRADRYMTVHENYARIFDAQTGEKIGSDLICGLDPPSPPNGDEVTMPFNPLDQFAFDSTGRHVYGLAPKRDEKRILDGHYVLNVWDSTNGARTKTTELPVSDRLPRHSRPNQKRMQMLCFSPDDSCFLMMEEDGSASLRKAISGEKYGSSIRVDSPIYRAYFSKDGQQVFTVHNIQRLERSWDVESGLPSAIRSRRTREEDKETKLLSLSTDNEWQFQFLDLRTQRPIAHPIQMTSRSDLKSTSDQEVSDHAADKDSGGQRNEFRDSSRILAIQKNADDSKVITVTGDGKLTVWDTEMPLPTADECITFLRSFIGVRIDDFGNSIPLSEDEQNAQWNDFLKRNEPWWRRTLELREERRIRVHENKSQSAEGNGQWFAAAFHLGWLLESRPNDETVKARYESVINKLKEQKIPPPRLPMKRSLAASN